MEYKLILTFVAAAIGFIGYGPYIRDVLRGVTKPHPFSWLTWGILELTAFLAQLAKGGGIGAWVTAASAAITLFIAFNALSKRDKKIGITDWLAFGGGLIGITLWIFSNNPLLAVVAVVIADALAFVPTFKKSFYHPSEETLIEYKLSVVKWTLAIFALEAYNLTTWLYPVSLMLTNGSFVVMSIVRKKQLKIAATKSI